MKRKIGGALALLLMTAVLVFPAFAQAVPVGPASITGTITAGASVAPTITVTVYEYREYSYGDVQWVFVDSDVTTASGTFTLDVPSVEGDYSGTFCVRATDATGAYEPTRTAGFKLTGGEAKQVGLVMHGDSTPPVAGVANWSTLVRMVTGKSRAVSVAKTPIIAIGSGNGPDAYSADDVNLLLQATDYVAEDGFSDEPGSGVATFTCSINHGASMNLPNPALASSDVWDWSFFSKDMTVTANGISAITYFATDKAGNASAKRTVLVYIDKTAPVTAYDMSTATGTSIKLVASDGGSGVAGTWWRMGTSGDFAAGTSVPVPATGVGHLEYYSVDHAGNLEEVKTLSIWAKAGLTRPKISASRPQAGHTFYVTGAVTRRSYASGSLHVYKLSKGTYRYVSKKSFTEMKSGSYKAAFKLKKGSYKFRAFYGANTSTSSNPPVKSSLSARASVR